MSIPARARRQTVEKRVPRDVYLTPPADAERCVAAIVSRGWLRPGEHLVAERHCGGGAFLLALAALHVPASTWRVGGIDPRSPGLELARHWGVRPFVGPCRAFPWRSDWTVGNPPYSGLEQTVERCLRESAVGVAFLLESAWLFRSAGRMARLPSPVGVFRFREGRRRFDIPHDGPVLGRRYLQHPGAPAVEHSWVVWMHERPAGLEDGQWAGGWL
jgi:hypothetical protein